MSGHSKWATIKHKKGALDAKRGKLFTRVIKEITIAARNGGDPDMNPRLRTAITAAKAVSMPADNIKKAIMRGTGELEGGQIEEVMFEGYGPGGAAVLVMVATDNRNRTVSEIRHMFSKNGGNLGEQGSVAWMFERKSQILIPEGKATEDQLMSIVLDAGADDLRNEGGEWEVISPPEAHESRAAGAAKGRHNSPKRAEIAMIPKNSIKLEGKNAAAMLRLSEASRRARRRAEHLLQLRRRREGNGSARPGADRARPMRILGVDCGSVKTGYGVIDTDGRDHRLVAAGVIRLKSTVPLRTRLCEIARELRELIRLHHARGRGGRGGLLFPEREDGAATWRTCAAWSCWPSPKPAWSCGEYSPLEVKISVVGYGRAEKQQVQMMIHSLLALQSPSPFGGCLRCAGGGRLPCHACGTGPPPDLLRRRAPQRSLLRYATPPPGPRPAVSCESRAPVRASGQRWNRYPTPNTVSIYSLP